MRPACPASCAQGEWWIGIRRKKKRIVHDAQPPAQYADNEVEQRPWLLRIVDNVAAHERAEHALNRIMSIDVLDGRIEICTTDVHLPRRIGRALKRAHDGELSIAFARDACGIRVGWHR